MHIAQHYLFGEVSKRLLCCCNDGVYFPVGTTLGHGGGSQPRALLPWVVDRSRSAPGCYLLSMGSAGIGSNLNLVVWTTALLLQEHPNNTVLLDSAVALSACPLGFAELLMPQQPAVLSTQHNNNTPANCQRMGHPAMAAYVRTYTGFPKGRWLGYVNQTGNNDGSSFFHQVSMPGMTEEARARHAEIWGAMWHALCPVVQEFWQLAPSMQQRQEAIKKSLRGNSSGLVVAIHVRGGDKLQSKTREVPVNFDYSFDKGLRLVAHQLSARSGSSTRTTARHLKPWQVQQQARTHGPVCLLFGDDKELIEQVRAQAQQILNCSVLQHAAAAGSYRPWEGQQCTRVQTMLSELDMLAWADYTVGTMWSNFDSIAFYAAVCSYGRQQSSYVDGSRNPFGPYV
jgi:hypothetical protein